MADDAALTAIHEQLVAAFPLRGPYASVELWEPFPGPTEDGSTRRGALSREGSGVWVGLRALRGESGSEGSILLLRVGELHDPRRDALVQGWIAALARIVEKGTSESLMRFSVGLLDVRMPLDVVGRVAPGEYTAAYLKQKWLGELLPPEEQTPVAEAYERAPASAVVENGEIHLDALLIWISRHGPRGVDRKHEPQHVEQLPPAARHLWYLFIMEGRVHNGGLASFLLQAPGYQVRGAVEALLEIGAEQLARLVRNGIRLAERSGAEFTRERDRTWRSRLALDGDFTSLSELEGHTEGRSLFLLYHELRPRMTRYASLHRDALIREGPPPPSGFVVRRRSK